MKEDEPAKPPIAVLEDHDDTRELWRVSLGEQFTVHDFQNAADLLNAIEPGKFSAVIADIMLPDLDGYAFIRRLRSDGRFQDLCVVAVTALAMRGDKEKAIEAGFTYYLTKPIDPSEIADAIWRCIKISVKNE